MKAILALRAFFVIPAEEETGEPLFDAPARDMGGKSAEIAALVAAISATVIWIVNLTLGLMRSAGHAG